jgi:hypothetical protein
MRLLRKALRIFLVVLVVFVVWSVFRAGTPAQAFRREITVNASRPVAWEHFSRPKQWASWLGSENAPTEVLPTDVLGPDTTAKFGPSFEFRMTEFAPYDHWLWSAKLAWLTIDYDHVFEPLDEKRTRMVFHQTVTGFGNDLLASLLRMATSLGGHQAALDRLADEINRLPAKSADR